MKKTLRMMGLCALAALAVVSCKKNEEKAAMTGFEATIAQPNGNGKTHVGTDNWLLWNAGDAIKVFDEDGNAATFTTNDNNTKVANFEGEIEASDRYCAFYPAGSTSDAAAGTVNLTLAATQTYKNGSFETNTYPMTAVNNGNSFAFSSPCGMLAIPVKGTGTLGSIELTGKDNEQLAGTYAFNLANMTNEFAGNAPTVTLNCENGLALSADEAATMFFVLPAGTLANGFTAVLKGTNGTELYRLETASDNTIAADMIRLMPEVTVQAVAVTTAEASNVVYTTATLNGSYEVPTGMTVTEVGFYWGNAAAMSNRVTASVGTSFTFDLEGLEEGTEYAYQAFAKNGETEYTGGVVTFETGVSIVLPTVTTTAATNVESTTATAGGSITDDGGGTISAYGISYSTTDGFEGADGTLVEGSDLNEGEFTVSLTQLSGKTTYYVRAYAENEIGRAYGEQVSFTTLPDGIVNGKAKFTINAAGDQVYFSMGNLQYIGSAGNGDENNTGAYWQFAANQFDCLGNTTGQGSDSKTVDRDLFGWGTSGWDNTTNDPLAVHFQPWETSTTSTSSNTTNPYGYGPSTNMTDRNLVGTSANYDWGVYNDIQNPVNGNIITAGTFRTLTQDEWTYVYSNHTHRNSTVNGKSGHVLRPDGVTDAIASSYSAEAWAVEEANGAVFLPVAGERSGTSMTQNGYRFGRYWSTTVANTSANQNACILSFYYGSSGGTISASPRYTGHAVRLVCPVE